MFFGETNCVPYLRFRVTIWRQVDHI